MILFSRFFLSRQYILSAIIGFLATLKKDDNNYMYLTFSSTYGF